MFVARPAPQPAIALTRTDPVAPHAAAMAWEDDWAVRNPTASPALGRPPLVCVVAAVALAVAWLKSGGF